MATRDTGTGRRSDGGGEEPARVATHLNPAGLPRSPAFSQGVAVSPWATTVLVGGQNAVDVDGAVTAVDVADQVVAALRNVELVLVEAGATLDDVVSWSVLLVEGQSPADAFAGFHTVWGARQDPPAVTVAFAPGLVDARFLVEISAVAAVAL